MAILGAGSIKANVCFLALNTYPILTGRNLGFTGGAEVQQVWLSRELMKRGYDVSFVTYHHGGADIEYVDGVRIIKTYPRTIATQLSPIKKLALTLRALDLADADLYLHMAGSAGVLTAYKLLRRRPFVYGIASDRNARGLAALSESIGIEMLGTRLDILTADCIVSQTSHQRRDLEQAFGKPSTVIKNPIPISQQVPPKTEPPTVLWAATVSRIKRPQLYVNLAKAIPDAEFHMIGGPTIKDSGLYDRILEAASMTSNLRFHGFVAFQATDDYFGGASIFVNTSEIEGFPNTFLQAWMMMTPVVTLGVDPDEVIMTNELGLVSHSFPDLVANVRRLLRDDELRLHMGENGRNYVKKQHDAERIGREYDTLIGDTLRAKL